MTSREAGFATSVTAGTFTINGKQISVSETDTLSDVISNINNSGAGVTAQYNSATDKLTLSGGSDIILGTSTDSSNFLQATRLSSGGASVTSAAKLGGISTSDSLNSARFQTALSTDNGTGQFSINGVTISYSASDTLSDVLDRINRSDARVTATYNSVNDRVVLTNKDTGSFGITAEDSPGQGNLLAALGVTTGTLTMGRDLIFSVNGGEAISSHSNTISSDLSGIQGLTVNALKTTDGSSSVTITIGSDTSGIKNAIDEFIQEYNKTQSLIGVQTSLSTDSDGKVTAGVLSNDRDVADLGGLLRRALGGDVSGLSGTMRRLQSIGYSMDGYSDQVRLSDSSALDNALENSLSDVQALFAGSADGLATRIDSLLQRVAGDDGSLVAHREALTTQSLGIDRSISDLERRIESDRLRLIETFTAMEKAMLQTNKHAEFIRQRFGF